MEIIRIVESSVISARRTLNELQVNRSSFYTWYDRYRKSGYEGLSTNRSSPNRFWNKIPYTERQKVIFLALDMPGNHQGNLPGI